ncbi:hypothetical protein GIB67_041656 [Kingdonia uniflora]|uniref:Uncharacterized protein n=1 Tax=Kingdonia uniflora TaxID=39325 RepID=A0A7J7MQK0_9MAGN|nr:hypothetical protein GIB67_041656 [Kingdonia uniflora]
MEIRSIQMDGKDIGIIDSVLKSIEEAPSWADATTMKMDGNCLVYGMEFSSFQKMDE